MLGHPLYSKALRGNVRGWEGRQMATQPRLLLGPADLGQGVAKPSVHLPGAVPLNATSASASENRPRLLA